LFNALGAAYCRVSTKGVFLYDVRGKRASKAKSMRVKRYFVPNNLDPEDLRKCGRRPEYVEKLLFFISTIHFRRVTNKTLNPNDWIPLDSRILAECIGKDFVAPVRKDLIKRGIIECDGSWQRNVACMGHRLTEKYRGAKMITIKARYPKESKKEEEIMTKAQEYIRRNLEKVTIEPQALANLEKSYPVAVRDLNQKYNHALASYFLIHDQNWFFATDRKTGRVYHNVANCPKEMRAHLRLDGRELVEVDISNCQPMLLHYLYEDKTSAEAVRYKKIAEEGIFYEVVAAVAGQTRDDAKGQFLTFAFGQIHHSNKLGRAFSTLFQELRAIMDGIKMGNYRKMAILLQKLEAELMINTVVPILEKRGMPVLTVHDSLMVFPEHAGQVQEIIKAECQRLYNLCPRLKTKGAVTAVYQEAA
jgi:hypothetical protein